VDAKNVATKIRLQSMALNTKRNKKNVMTIRRCDNDDEEDN
jgi:hypothetical protein